MEVPGVLTSPRFWPAVPSRPRAPAMAAASAEFWHCVLATAITPRSMAKATKPHMDTIVRTASGRTEPGEAFGLLGPNRAGKTTLVKVLLSLCRPTAGEATRLG